MQGRRAKQKFFFRFRFPPAPYDREKNFDLKTAKVFTEMEAKRLRLESRQMNPAKALLISRQDY